MRSVSKPTFPCFRNLTTDNFCCSDQATLLVLACFFKVVFDIFLFSLVHLCPIVTNDFDKGQKEEGALCWPLFRCCVTVLKVTWYEMITKIE